MYSPEESGASSPVSDDSGVFTSPAQAAQTRDLERKQLAALNDRLAIYIEHVRRLQSQNDQLTLRLDEERRASDSAVSNIRALYDKEVENLRKSLDHEAKQRGRLQIEVRSLEQHRNDLLSKVDAQKISLDRANQHAEALDSKIIHLEICLDKELKNVETITNQIEQAEMKIISLQDEMKQIEERAATESLEKVDLKNRCTTLAEDLEFKTKLFDKQLRQLTEQRHEEIHELEKSMQMQHTQHLKKSLEELRNEYQTQIGANRNEIEVRYRKQIKELKERAASQKKVIAERSGQLKISQSTLQRVEKHVTELKTFNEEFSGKIRSLQDKLSEERAYFTQQLSDKNEQLLELEASSCQQLKEYGKLIDIKLSLDAEIAAYRQLLEMEEKRLKLPVEKHEVESPPPTHPPSPLSSVTSRLVGCSARRQDVADTNVQNLCAATLKRGRRCRSLSKSPVSVRRYRKLSVNECHAALELSSYECRVCKFISVLNNSSKPVSLSGLRLTRHSPGDNKTVEFRFPDEMAQLLPGEQARVWSAGCAAIDEVSACAPHELVMDAHLWPAEANVVTTLYDQQKVLAKLILNRTSQLEFSSGE